MISGATRYRLASRVVKAAAGPFEFISRLRPATVTERVLRRTPTSSNTSSTSMIWTGTRDLLLGLASAPLNNRGNVYADVKKATIACQERLELASLVRDYQDLKRRLGLVEFADQMAIAARLATEVPQVSSAMRAAFRVVLLDEYQDTSAAQAIMLRGCSPVRPPTTVAASGDRGGDPFQAIYGWRGAAASNILTFADDFPRLDGRPAHRLDSPSTGAAGGDPRRRKRAQPAAANRNRQCDSRQHGTGRPCRCWTRAAACPRGTPSGQVRAATFETWPEEISWIADQIAGLRAEGEVSHWADVAVLTRRNADIAPLYAELTSRNVPVEIVGLGGLLHLPEIMDITATLRLIDDVTANPT